MVAIKNIITIILLFIISFSVSSEGSFELRNRSEANDPVGIESRRDGVEPSLSIGLPRSTVFYVDIFDSQNEVIDLYTSNPSRSNSNIDIAVWCPNNRPANPESANSFQTADRVINVVQNGNGYINSWNDVVSVQEINTRVRPPQTFNPLNEGCGDGVYTVRFFSHATNEARSFDNSLKFMDIRVRNTFNNTLDSGRVFSRHYSLIQNGFGAELNFKMFVVEGEDLFDSYEGYIWEVDANGIQPFGFQLVSNSVGANPIEYNDDSVQLNANPNPVVEDEYNIYLNYPEKPVGLPPTQPNVTNFFYRNICPDDNDPNGYTTGGYFNFYSDGVWKYKLYIDLNDDGQVNLDEKVFQGTAGEGLNEVYWDGILPDGSTIQNGTNLKFNLYLSDGEVHFPFSDVENRGFNTGPIFTLVNTSTSDSSLYYWNDTRVGGDTAGIEGSANVHTWGNDLGNNVIIDTFKYAYNDGLQKDIIYGGECENPDLGGNVSGFVFDDLNHNGSRETNEPGIEDVTIVLHNLTNNDCETQKTDENGAFLFDNILVSTFNLVEAANETLPISKNCPPLEEDPDGYISVDSNTKPVEFNERNASYITFANFKGYKIEGNVFEDNGLGSNQPFDGIQNGTEKDIKSVKIDAFDSGSFIESQFSNGEGEFEFWIRDNVSNLDLIAENKSEFINVSSDVGDTNGSKSGNNEINITGLGIGFYSGVSFGYIQEPSITQAQTQNVEAGSTTLFTHKYKINSIGDVSFSIQNENKTPSSLDTNALIYNDDNCNGQIDSGTDSTNVSNLSVNVNSNNELCLIVKVFTPLNAPNNSTYSFDINAETDYITIPLVVDKKATDLTIISDSTTNANLTLTKTVDKLTAAPNEVITYSVVAKNNGSNFVSNIVINDFTPNFTNFVSAICPSTLPSEITSCNVTESPNVGEKGNVKWSFNGNLNTGEEIIITYQVRVDN